MHIVLYLLYMLE